jgi:lipid A 3-O-deacylase PagL
MRAVLPLYALLALAPALAIAQAPTEPAPHRAERLIGGWVGASVAPSTRFGYIDDRRFVVAGLRAQYLLDTFGPVALASTIDVIPLAVLSNTPTYETLSIPRLDGTIFHVKSVTGRSAVYGAGIAPAGFQLYTRSVRPARFFIGASGGLLWFTRDTPVPDARRMNFTAEGGAGAELLSRDGRAVVVGYKFQHMSNGGTARLNPGFDSHLLYIGLMHRRGGRRSGHEVPAVGR